jgi:Xaa-Pro aminopeptidase
MNHRIHKLRQRLHQEHLDAILVSQGENRRYLSGFTGSAGFLLVTEKDSFLATDFRYIEQAKGQAPDFDIVHISEGLHRWLSEILSSLDIANIGFEADNISFAAYRELAKAIGKKQLVPTERIVESLRAVKDEDELKLITKAVEIADAAFEEVVPTLRPGMTEKEAAWALEKSMREKDSDCMPFEIIVASGPNAALPHHHPSERAMQSGEPVIIDMGARVEGYSSDLSRTICLGSKGGKKFGKIYDLVLGAQLTAIATVEAGMSGELADSLGRTVIEQGGHGDDFGHGLGHGVGLAPHELPRLGRGSTDTLEDGMVFTVEPGIYITGWGGVRIEDVVVLEQGRAKVLSNAKK